MRLFSLIQHSGLVVVLKSLEVPCQIMQIVMTIVPIKLPTHDAFFCTIVCAEKRSNEENKELLTAWFAAARVLHWKVGDVCFVGWRPVAFSDILMIGYSQGFLSWLCWQMLCQHLQIKVKAIKPEFLYDEITVFPSYDSIGIRSHIFYLHTSRVRIKPEYSTATNLYSVHSYPYFCVMLFQISYTYYHLWLYPTSRIAKLY